MTDENKPSKNTKTGFTVESVTSYEELPAGSTGEGASDLDYAQSLAEDLGTAIALLDEAVAALPDMNASWYEEVHNLCKKYEQGGGD